MVGQELRATGANATQDPHMIADGLIHGRFRHSANRAETWKLWTARLEQDVREMEVLPTQTYCSIEEEDRRKGDRIVPGLEVDGFEACRFGKIPGIQLVAQPRKLTWIVLALSENSAQSKRLYLSCCYDLELERTQSSSQ